MIDSGETTRLLAVGCCWWRVSISQNTVPLSYRPSRAKPDQEELNFPKCCAPQKPATFRNSSHCTAKIANGLISFSSRFVPSEDPVAWPGPHQNSIFRHHFKTPHASCQGTNLSCRLYRNYASRTDGKASRVGSRSFCKGDLKSSRKRRRADG